MIRKEFTRRSTAVFFLCLMFTDLIIPKQAKALTSGPAQPEAKQFMEAGTSDMVDLFTGDFKYNIPLLDVDGYPINLNYQGNADPEEEATWVGLGWNLNVGAINRQLRGVPDDMSGDEVVTEHSVKPKITVGGRVTGRVELKGTDMAKVSGSISIGVFSDNYTGIGADLGGNAGLTLGLSGGGAGTSGLGLTGELGFTSSTASGVDVNPSISLAWRQRATDRSSGTASLSVGLGYNTREGLKALSLGSSFGLIGQGNRGSGSASYELATSTYNFNTPPVYPSIQIPYRNSGSTFSGDFGGTGFTLFAGGGFTGYKRVREVANRFTKNNAYGALYSERGKDVKSAVMDFQREKENIIIPSLPNLPMPVSTPDMFAYSGQAGSGQFRLYRGTSGIYFDAESRDVTQNTSGGGDVGIGAYAHGGVSFYKMNEQTVAGKWKDDNNYITKGDFEDLAATNYREEAAYFKQVGEKNAEDAGFTAAIKQEKTVWVDVKSKTATARYAFINDQQLRQADGIVETKVKKTGRQARRSAIAYQTAYEASHGGLDKMIKNYPLNSYVSFTPPSCGQTATTIARYDNNYHRQHHISEMTVTGDDGKRMVYGLPVYNIKQEEYTYAVDNATVLQDAATIATDNLVTYKLGDKTTDQYFKKETQPAYATSYLLTGVLSPDYVDRTGDGITDDDLGTAIKFNYGKLPSVYKWRSPYQQNKGFYNKGLYADPDDDKGSFVYGEKEIWYLSSIETKTKIVYFLMDDRKDGLGVLDYLGGKNSGVKQKVLKEIRMYSKSDLTKPIKTVVLNHGYTLCSGVPNSDESGKLTLNSLYFTYGNSSKGQNHPYVFTYNNTPYAVLSSDRWGTYKPGTANATDEFGDFKNNEFPYTTRNTAAANANAGMWQLKAVTLPGGGILNVEYESDDYAYVQDKRSMEMVKVLGLYKIENDVKVPSTLAEAVGVKLKMAPGDIPPNPNAENTAYFIRKYLDNSKNLYVKLSVNVTDEPGNPIDGVYDFVPAYGEVAHAYFDTNAGEIFVEFSKVDNFNPLYLAALQKMKLEYPMFAYPGYKNRVVDNKPLEAVLSAVVNSFKTLGELSENFYARARRLGYAANVQLNRSFARIVKMDGKRLGGGSRVKKISISDDWANLTNPAINTTAVYGQEYCYETKIGDRIVSSGVASYEPSVGGDENPMHQPIPYTQDIKGALNNYLYLEEPFGETLFPAPQVGYSKVTVRDIDETGGKDNEQMTGYSIHEFYTAKDYPVITRHSSIETHNRHPNGFSSFVSGHELHELAMTQGYTVILNDMHGKPKSDRIYNKSDAEISAVNYYYVDEVADAGKKKLSNLAYTVNEKGEVSQEKEVIGREMELFTDMRQEETSNRGQSIHIGVDVIPFIFGSPLPLPHWPVKNNDEYRLFRSAAVTKIAHYYGIMNKIIKTENGSTVTTQNLVYDRYTGEPVVSSVTNEFGDPVYNLNLPAYWAYGQMGGAYQNVNTVFRKFSTAGSGIINSAFTPYLSPGDELINIKNTTDQERYWVVNSPTSNNATKVLRLIDRYGAIVSFLNSDMKIVRSGYRNLIGANISSIVSLDNPVRNNQIRLDDDVAEWMRVLDAKAVVFDEAWSMPDECTTCPPGYTKMEDGSCIIPPNENTSDQCYTFCAGSSNSDYSMNGAYVYESMNATTAVNVRSAFWGGVSCTGLNSFMTGEDVDSASFSMKAAGGMMGINAVVPCVRSTYTISNPYCGRLNKCGIWLCTGNGTNTMPPYHAWVGFEKCVTIPESGYYYVGMGGDNFLRVSIPEVSFNMNFYNDYPTNYRNWHVVKVYLNAGTITIRGSGNNAEAYAAFGVELYKGNSDGTLPAVPEIIFSTKDIMGKPVQASVETSSNVYEKRYTSCGNGTALSLCPYPNCGVIPPVINPYQAGFLGNWRIWQEKAYLVGRVDNDVLNASTKGARLRNSGHYKLSPWYYYNTGQQQWTTTSNLTTANKWATSRTARLYNKSGSEIENSDALGRYSSAIYGFGDLLPVAVANNAMNREIFYDGMEDYTFRDRCGIEVPCSKYPFDIKQAVGSSIVFMKDNSMSHSGNYSLQLTSFVELRTTPHTNSHKWIPGIEQYLGNTLRGEYKRVTNTVGVYNNGFAPYPDRKYIFSCWVYDNQPTSSSTGITIKLNNVDVTLAVKAVVEKWKLVEGEITFPNLGTEQVVRISSASSTTRIDDVRIFPYNAHIKSYAYDEFSLRLMAEMDENNFATFYEYDEEGSLVRVKKETERGIMTLKESRSALRKN